MAPSKASEPEAPKMVEPATPKAATPKAKKPVVVAKPATPKRSSTRSVAKPAAPKAMKKPSPKIADKDARKAKKETGYREHGQHIPEGVHKDLNAMWRA